MRDGASILGMKAFAFTKQSNVTGTALMDHLTHKILSRFVACLEKRRLTV
jgi:hypothetical protein